MKKLLVFCCLLLVSCAPKKRIFFDGVATYRTNRSWKQDFKDRILCNCLLKGIGSKAITDTIVNIDHSFSNEIDILFRDEIDTVLNSVIFKMKTDSAISLKTQAEGWAGKHVFDTCLKFYKSKKLDSIARAMLLKWNSTPEDSVMNYLNKK